MSSTRLNIGVGVLGGTFDPIHLGHLQLVTELREQLSLERILLMPDFQPVHRNTPTASVTQRLQMLQIAIEEHKDVFVDDREIKRQGPSYTLFSLQELRTELGPDIPLFFILGADAFCDFDHWHEWKELIQYAHLLVASRPGDHTDVSKQLAVFIDTYEHQSEDYPTTAFGSVIFMTNKLLNISSSDIRQRLADKKDVHYLVPPGVSSYIEQHKIYG